MAGKFLPGSLLRLQLREEHHVSDRITAREHHDEAVDADADAAGGGHAVFEGEEEFLVELLRFFAGPVFEGFGVKNALMPDTGSGV